MLLVNKLSINEWHLQLMSTNLSEFLMTSIYSLTTFNDHIK